MNKKGLMEGSSRGQSEDILQFFRLVGEQGRAVRSEGVDVVVTAGAGSGKTRTLTARYLWLLDRGVDPRRIVAITFTEKAAREMRNRIRESIRKRALYAGGEEAARWREFQAGMDAARIGTIHSLCSEILKNHPAEAEVDPQFEVADEAEAAALRQAAVEEALLWAVEDPEAARLFQTLSVSHLEKLVGGMLLRRLDLGGIEGEQVSEARLEGALANALGAYVDHEEVRACLAALRSFSPEALIEDANEKLAARIQSLIEGWGHLKQTLKARDPFETARILFDLRREHMGLEIGKKGSTAKEGLRRLRELYKERVDPWLGGEDSSDNPPDRDLEARFIQDRARLDRLYREALRRYRRALERRSALDFDDLEQGALELLQRHAIQEKWAGTFDAVLVDEFQDTNGRQREIIERLVSDQQGALFIVGDARQSIYRFRGADVTVFRALQGELQAKGGEHVELDLTFRGHPDLLKGFDAMLPSFMGLETRPEAPYAIPYTPMRSHREGPREGIDGPYVELILGLGEDAESARPNAAAALVDRLADLHGSGALRDWDDVALLFRASTGFPFYEEALEARGVPFVTVAGGGFYNRPEIRDLLNILRAMAEPWDDTAMAGLLRSPAFGVSDAGLWQLRHGPEGVRPLRQAIEGKVGGLGERDQAALEGVREFLRDMAPKVERAPVVELLKEIIDRRDLRALLASGEARAWRNVDKLLEDARASELTRISAFFQYLQTLREVGAREGEAPSEALGAVQLMTIHKAKGLEFPVVVLADASRQAGGRTEAIHLLPEVGPAWKPDRQEAAPLAYGISKWLDKLQSEAEEARVLYVALTRSREKLLISGHLTGGDGKWQEAGWTGGILEALEVEPGEAVGGRGKWQRLSASEGAEIGLYVAEAEIEGEKVEGGKIPWPESAGESLVAPVHLEDPEVLDELMAQEPSRLWRATGERLNAPAAVVGLILHEALARGLSPGDPLLGELWESLIYRQGIMDEGQRRRTVREAERLLERFLESDLWGEVERAEERYHELPFTRRGSGGKPDSGRIDLLYRTDKGWQVVDFKADELRNEKALLEAVEEYKPQMQRYRGAVRDLLGEVPQVRLCFLDYQGGMRLVTV